MCEKLRNKLKEDIISPVEVELLASYQNKDLLLLVSPEVDLIDTALLLAQDKKNEVKDLLTKELLIQNPTIATKDEDYQLLIIQPFALIQKI